MKKYLRASLEVDAVQYTPGQSLEDGFELYTKVITNGWINSDNLIQVKREDGNIVCPFIENKRGRVFLAEGDYIIYEADSERHVCGPEKFHLRFKPADES